MGGSDRLPLATSSNGRFPELGPSRSSSSLALDCLDRLLSIPAGPEDAVLRRASPNLTLRAAPPPASRSRHNSTLSVGRYQRMNFLSRRARLRSWLATA